MGHCVQGLLSERFFFPRCGSAHLLTRIPLSLWTRRRRSDGLVAFPGSAPRAASNDSPDRTLILLVLTCWGMPGDLNRQGYASNNMTLNFYQISHSTHSPYIALEARSMYIVSSLWCFLGLWPSSFPVLYPGNKQARAIGLADSPNCQVLFDCKAHGVGGG